MYDNNNFFSRVKGTVYKWWCVVYKPVYKLMHHGYWPQEKEPYYIPNNQSQGLTANEPQELPPSQELTQSSSDQQDQTLSQQQRLLAEQMAKEITQKNQHHIDELVTDTEELDLTPDETLPQNDTVSPSNSEEAQEIDTSNVDDDVLSRANEIMARLAREAAEDEEKKQAEIDKAKQDAETNARLASIMKANQIDISAYIEEGKAHQNDNK